MQEGVGVRLSCLHLIKLGVGNHGSWLGLEISREMRGENWKLVTGRFCPTFCHNQSRKHSKEMKDRSQRLRVRGGRKVESFNLIVSELGRDRN